VSLPTLVVEAAFTAGAVSSPYLHLDDSARGKLDTGTLAADETWADITDYVHAVTVDRGSTRADGPNVTYEAGTATVTLNNSDRRFDPTNLDGPYVAAGATQLVPMVALRVRAIWDGTTYDLFRGYIDAWQVSYEGPNYSRVSLPATDGFKVLGNGDRVAVAAVGAGEDSGARISRILDSADWPVADRLIATGDTTVQATTLDGPALTELQLTADTELGELYVDGAGRLVFRNRLAQLEDTRSNTPQAVFGDGGGAELPYADVEIAYDDTGFANRVLITRVGGAAQTAEDTDSQAAYLVRTFERSDLIMETDDAAGDYADLALYQASTPELRFTALTVNPLTDTTTLFPQVLGREIGDRITVLCRPPGGGDPIERDCFIRGISHDDLRPGSWGETTWTLQSAEKWAFLLLDNAALGRLDENAIAA